jgi:hypothetical protein
LTGTLSGFIARVKPAPFGLLCAWREVPILRQQGEPFRSQLTQKEHEQAAAAVPGSAVVASGAVAAMASGSAVTETSGVTAVTSGSAAVVTFESEVVLVTPSPEDVARHRVPPPDSSRTPPVHPPHEGIKTSSQEGGEGPPRSSKHIRI